MSQDLSQEEADAALRLGGVDLAQLCATVTSLCSEIAAAPKADVSWVLSDQFKKLASDGQSVNTTASLQKFYLRATRVVALLDMYGVPDKYTAQVAAVREELPLVEAAIRLRK